MIGYLKGKVIFRGQGFIILDTGNIGYKVYVPKFGLRNSTFEGYIHHHIREDTSDLYGFETPEELEFFELLLSVPGVGPKMAQNVMAAGEMAKLSEAIIKSDVAVLTAVAGVGNKLASKIVVELKSKLSRGAIVDLAQFGQESAELVDALVALGYSRREIAQVLPKLPQDFKSTSEKVTWALKHLTRLTGSGS